MKSDDTFNETLAFNETLDDSLNESDLEFLSGPSVYSRNETGPGSASLSPCGENASFPPAGPGGYRGYGNKSELSDYLQLIRPYVRFIVLIFALSAFAGYGSLSYFPDLAEMVTESFEASFGSLLDMHPIFIMLFIFLNNSFVGLLLIVLGLVLGIAPVLIIAFNGFVVGVISRVVSEEIGIFRILLALLPHGIVELPMIFLAGGIGLRLGHRVLLSLSGKPADVKKEIRRGILFYFRRVVPLLFVAAVIETFITPLIFQLFQS
ncbi:MAG: stage II sporulation protein M [Methanosarcinaceae archaeon]|nr:stage II sporulation protein M [Methanosarcinaceae archaeon]